jgi:CRP/FNR family transcriptional regulator, cyclic AMP receptor protein
MMEGNPVGAAEQLSLDNVPLFGDLAPQKRETLMEMCAVRRYAGGDVIVPAGQGANGEVAFVLDGQVRVGAPLGEHGRITFEDLGPGGYYGALSALDGRLPLGSVIARDDCSLAIMPAEEFIKVLSQNGKACVTLLRDLAARLTASTDRQEAQASGNHVQRIYGELLRLAEPGGEGTWVINPMPKHREIADRADTSEESAATAIAHLIRVGLARRKYPALELLDRMKIRELCDLR